ncbi:hypothetical protein [Halorussus salilacus]|uniref:hypothetical protein n=1 Tax=Halorussus salilacus TaxID=2953750 RepID=UPI0034A3D21A
MNFIITLLTIGPRRTAGSSPSARSASTPVEFAVVLAELLDEGLVVLLVELPVAEFARDHPLGVLREFDAEFGVELDR